MASVYETITAQIVASIEHGAGEFHMPWHRQAGSNELPYNVQSGNCYSGGNVMVLWCASMDKGYPSPVWGTYKQWAAHGCQVRKGEKATTGIYYGTFEKESDNGDVKHLAFGKAFWVFNADQVDGYTASEPKALIDLTERVAAADATIANTGAIIKNDAMRSFYRPSTDEIYVVDRERFVGTETSTPTESYYSTLLHELSHWTGHKARLDRASHKRFGDETYAMEELIAELSAAFLCARLQIANQPRADHAQYMASWLKVLKNDTRAIVSAASAAQKACDYVMGAHKLPVAIAA